MSDHFNTDRGFPQDREGVRALSQGGRHELMSLCDVEPADFINCLACYAYGVEQELSDEEMFETTTARQEAPETQSLYRTVLAVRNQLAEEVTAARDESIGDRQYSQGYLAGLDRAISIIRDRDGIS